MSFRLEEMTTEDKLKAMEILWDDICRNLPDFSSPAWHENILKENEVRIYAVIDCRRDPAWIRRRMQ